MHYVWQWHRIPQYLYRIVDGELIFGPLIDGLMVTLEIGAYSIVWREYICTDLSSANIVKGVTSNLSADAIFTESLLFKLATSDLYAER